ncbi:mitochondrial carrier, partial [Ophiobolus disseminans]
MATSRDAPNPLRPYYIPPSIGLPPDTPQNQSSPAPYSSRSLSKPSLGSQARDILSDLDYDSYFPETSPTVAGHAKRLLDQALWNYTSVLLAQPFEVAKTILQIHEASGQLPDLSRLKTEEWGGRSRPDSFHSGKYVDYPSEEESDEDSPGYFTSTAPRNAQPAYSPGASQSLSPNKRSQSRRSRSRSETPTRAPPTPHRKLDLKRPDSLLEVIAQLWQKESAWGVWKGTNVTFIYNFLLKTTESWFRSAICAIINIPDPGLVGSTASGIGGLDIIDSPSPLTSLAVAVAATAIAATILAPLDLIRTRLIVTPISSQPRSIYPCLALLPSFSISSRLLPATLLHACVPTLISSSTPLVLRSTLSIDPILTPTTYSISTFLSSTAELFMRLPLETVLRRGQVAVLQDHENERMAASYTSTSRQKTPALDDDRSFKTIVEPGSYRGVLGSMWFIARDEGITVASPNSAKAASAKAMGFERPSRMRKGQGVHGLWRGWRVGVWGLVGIWGAAAMGGGGGEF